MGSDARAQPQAQPVPATAGTATDDGGHSDDSGHSNGHSDGRHGDAHSGGRCERCSDSLQMLTAEKVGEIWLGPWEKLKTGRSCEPFGDSHRLPNEGAATFWKLPTIRSVSIVSLNNGIRSAIATHFIVVQ